MSDKRKKPVMSPLGPVASRPPAKVVWKNQEEEYQRVKARSERGLVNHIQAVPWQEPAPLPSEWQVIRRLPFGLAAKHTSGMSLMVSCGVELDGKRWLHLSVSYTDHMPSYKEMAAIKPLIMGTDTFAYEIFAPETGHVNHHAHCRHLWCCLDGPVTPDFTRGNGSL